MMNPHHDCDHCGQLSRKGQSLVLVRQVVRLIGWQEGAPLSSAVHDVSDSLEIVRYCNHECFEASSSRLALEYGWRYLYPSPAAPVATCCRCGELLIRTRPHVGWALLAEDQLDADFYEIGTGFGPVLVAVTCIDDCRAERIQLLAASERECLALTF